MMTAAQPRTLSIACLLAFWAHPTPAAGAGKRAQEPLEILVGPQTVVMEDAIFPYMTTTREGTIIVVGTVLRPNPESYTGPNYPRDIPRTVRSADGGKTWILWSPTEEQGDGPIISGCTLQLRSGRILIFDYYSRFIGDGRFQGQVWHSDDQWQTVTPSPYIAHVPRAKPNLGDDRGDTVPTGILWHRTILEMPNGNLLAGIYGVFKEDDTPSQYRPSMKQFRALLLRSTDVGKNWSYVSTIAAGPMGQEGFNEPVIVRLNRGKHEGRLVCLMRTGRENPIYQAHSDDEGATWSQAQPMRWQYSRWGRWRDIVGVDPDLIEMHDGTLVASFGHKPDFKDDGIFVAFSVDQGHSWTQVTRLAMDITGAYTTVREIRPGKLFVVYDKRDDYYTSPSRRIYGRTIEVKRP